MKLRPPTHFYLKTRAEMMQLFGEVEDALDRTWDIAQRCQVKLEKVKEPFPKFDVPDEPHHRHLLRVRRPPGLREAPRRAWKRMRAQGALKHDLPRTTSSAWIARSHMIQQMKFSGYFLIVWDFIRYAKSKGIPVGPGRGSAAGQPGQLRDGASPTSIRCSTACCSSASSIRSASACPISTSTSARNRRGEVIQYVTEKYGREQVAQIITFGTLGARAAHQGRRPRART